MAEAPQAGTEAEIIALMVEHNLLVRPTITGQWAAGRFKGIDLVSGKVYDWPETHTEGWDMAEVVRAAAVKDDALRAQTRRLGE